MKAAIENAEIVDISVNKMKVSTKAFAIPTSCPQLDHQKPIASLRSLVQQVPVQLLFAQDGMPILVKSIGAEMANGIDSCPREILYIIAADNPKQAGKRNSPGSSSDTTPWSVSQRPYWVQAFASQQGARRQQVDHHCKIRSLDRCPQLVARRQVMHPATSPPALRP